MVQATSATWLSIGLALAQTQAQASLQPIVERLLQQLFHHSLEWTPHDPRNLFVYFGCFEAVLTQKSHRFHNYV